MLGEFQVQDGILELYTGREETVVIPPGVHTIGKGALKACTSMKKAVLPPGLKFIMAEAFKGCRKLEEIEIPEGVTRIGDYAFHRCHSLKRILLPTSVKELGDCVFLYCDSLEEAGIPGVQRLGKQAFVNDVCLKKLILSEELREDCLCDVFTGCGYLTEFSFGEGRRFVIPSAVEAVAGHIPLPDLVRAIVFDILRMMELEGRTLLQFRTNLKHVELPEGIERIGKSCFYDKRGILSIILPKSLQEIESRAFRNCINLETISFQREPDSIHEDAFKNCTSLKNIRTPDGLTYELNGVRGLSAKGTPILVRTIHRQILSNFRISGNLLLKYLGGESRVVVPEGITAIAEEAFAGNETIDRVILPESLEEIGAGAFQNCLLLQTIPFPQKLRRIGAGAFENCVKLLRVSLPQGLTVLDAKVFKRCQALKEVSLGNIREIGEQAFYGCLSLTELTFPRELTSVGDMAFYRCSAFREVRLPKSVESVGNLAFALSGIRKACVQGSGRKYGNGLFYECTRLKSLVLEEGVCHIADRFAYGCTSLKRVSLPDSLESVGRNVWEKTPFLADWIMDVKESEQGLGRIFWDGRYLEGEVRLPDPVRIVAGGAFYGNEKITKVRMPEEVWWVGAAAFKGCGELRRVYWPSGVDILEEEVFAGCRKLEAVDGFRRVVWRKIGQRAFYGCESLKSVCLEYVSEIGGEAFSGCRGLERSSVGTMESAVKCMLRIGERAFEDTAYQDGEAGQPVVVGNIVVSADACEGKVCLPEGITGIAPYAFAGNRSITEVTFPESLIQIGEGAFWGCSGLTQVDFPKRSCMIGRHAFEKCVSLQKVQAAVVQLGRAAFAYCLALKRAVISGISIFPERLFEGCEALEECVCGHVKAVGAHCFSGCRSLESFDFRDIYVIREYGFAGCDDLRKVEFLRDGACVGAHAFEDCGRLEEIRLWGEMEKLCLKEYAFSGCTALRLVGFRDKDWRFGSYGDIVSEEIPEMVRLIFHSAMSCFEVEREEILCGYRGAGRIVKIPQGIRRIEAEVFRDILMLEDVEIPESVEYIGARAFHQTAWMDRRRSLSPLVTVNHMLLDGSGCMGEVTVPEDIRLVCGWAFANGLGIERIRFLSHRTRVEEYAFRNCINLRDIILPGGVCVSIEGIGDRKKELPPLAKQAVMDSLNCFKTNEGNVLVECTGNISMLRIAEGITAIGEGAFQDGNLLTEVIFPPTITRVEKRAFAGCKWLRRVWQAYSVEFVGDMAFYGCGALESVELFENLRQLGARAFENCTSLEDIVVPEGVEEIPDKAFYRCHSLKRVQLPSTLKRIGKEAFAFCWGLEEITIPAGVLVGERAFVGTKADGKEQAVQGSRPGHDAGVFYMEDVPQRQ